MAALATALLGTIMQSTWMLAAVFAVIAGLAFELSFVLMCAYMLDVTGDDVKLRSRISTRSIMASNSGQVTLLGIYRFIQLMYKGMACLHHHHLFHYYRSIRFVYHDGVIFNNLH